jgi:aminoglycoside 6'-N-acetyltransferase I
MKVQDQVRIRAAERADCAELARLRAMLWPETSAAEHRRQLELGFTAAAAPLPTAIFVAECENETLVGFLETGLRSHADGCDPSRAVGFIEGWYVREGYRRQGIGKALVIAAEKWARGEGCREMASDALIANHSSQKAHEALGYAIVDRCVHYRKSLP